MHYPKLNVVTFSFFFFLMNGNKVFNYEYCSKQICIRMKTIHYSTVINVCFN